MATPLPMSTAALYQNRARPMSLWVANTNNQKAITVWSVSAFWQLYKVCRVIGLFLSSISPEGERIKNIEELANTWRHLHSDQNLGVTI
jgi:hypothetical protein